MDLIKGVGTENGSMPPSSRPSSPGGCSGFITKSERSAVAAANAKTSSQLLEDRLTLALATEPVISCAVPLPSTMPGVKISKDGLPLPLPAKGGLYLFKKMSPTPELGQPSQMVEAAGYSDCRKRPTSAPPEKLVATSSGDTALINRLTATAHKQAVQLGRMQSRAANLELHLAELKMEEETLQLSNASISEETADVEKQKVESGEQFERMDREKSELEFSSAQLTHLLWRERGQLHSASARVEVIRKKLSTAQLEFQRLARRNIELQEEKSEMQRLAEVMARVKPIERPVPCRTNTAPTSKLHLLECAL